MKLLSVERLKQGSKSQQILRPPALTLSRIRENQYLFPNKIIMIGKCWSRIFNYVTKRFFFTMASTSWFYCCTSQSHEQITFEMLSIIETARQRKAASCWWLCLRRKTWLCRQMLTQIALIPSFECILCPTSQTQCKRKSSRAQSTQAIKNYLASS